MDYGRYHYQWYENHICHVRVAEHMIRLRVLDIFCLLQYVMVELGVT